MQLTEIQKTWGLIALVVIAFTFAYGYELEYYKRQDDATTLASYCARGGALPMLCDGSVRP